jgi:electron transfer flavoprotein alpha subunit
MPVALAVEQIPSKLVIIDDPAFLVLVVADAANGRLSPHDRQVLGAGRQLAAGGGAVILIGAVAAEEAGAAGADRLIALERDWDPEGRTADLACLIETLSPRHVLFPETGTGGDLARRLAAATGEALFPGAESISPLAVGRPARGHKVEQRRTPPRLITIVADVVAGHGGTIHEARRIEIASVPIQRAILSAEVIPADPARVPLSEADFVLSAGNGVSDFDSFRILAAALGATPGASRMVCDAGLMPRAAQVGASGTVLGATCYFALGIAGAPQHLQGITRVEHVVAVNTDLHAAMIERAGLAIVADAQKVMPALIAALETEMAP